MFKSITMDEKGNVYIVPQDVIKEHCKKIKAGELLDIRGTGFSDWPNCYLWINGGDEWINCPPDLEAIQEMVSKRDLSSKEAIIRIATDLKSKK
jgi:hypothetical protein